MPFDDIVKAWTSLESAAKKNGGSDKAYLTQLNVVGGAGAAVGTSSAQPLKITIQP